MFDALHRRGRVNDAILQAFDLLELDGVDYRPLPLRQRKDRLARLLARVHGGIALNEHTDARGELVFRQASAMGLEGIVSKRLVGIMIPGAAVASPSRTKSASPHYSAH
jgi:ATP-dependent DNA ligase